MAIDVFAFALFIFSVGIQAGPAFFSAFAADGLRYVTLACVVAATAVALTLVLARLVGLEYGFSAGMLAGALTSTPTLAGAQDAVRGGLATLPEAVSQAKALENIGVGYAITYLFGTLGMILLVRFLPRIAGIDLPAEAAKLARERAFGRGRRRATGGSPPIVRAYRLPADMVGKTVAQVDAETGHLPGKVLRIKRGSELLEGAPDRVLEAGDLVCVIAGIDVHEGARGKDAAEVLDSDLLNYQVTTREIVVTDVKALGKSLKDLDLPNAYGCFATGLTRASIELTVDPNLPLQKGDRLEVVGEKDNLQRLAATVGFVEQEIEKTDLATFANVLLTFAGALMVRL